MIGVDSTRVVCPLFQEEEGGSTPASTLQVSDLVFERCPRRFAVALNRTWHSRLPNILDDTISYAFHARYGDVTYIVAIWSNPVSRMLPSHWLELRRMACSTETPKNAASAFLAWMVRYFRSRFPKHERLISYQDTEVHQGTIYRAAGWTDGHRTRQGDTWQTGNRGRVNQNGSNTIASVKVRWEKRIAQEDRP